MSSPRLLFDFESAFRFFATELPELLPLALVIPPPPLAEFTFMPPTLVEVSICVPPKLLLSAVLACGSAVLLLPPKPLFPTVFEVPDDLATSLLPLLLLFELPLAFMLKAVEVVVRFCAEL